MLAGEKRITTHSRFRQSYATRRPDYCRSSAKSGQRPFLHLGSSASRTIGLDRVKATYRDNYDCLVDIKRKYDPDNFFRINQNIRPQ
jgi:FAD/FMN-containing dehydrogenase